MSNGNIKLSAILVTYNIQVNSYHGGPWQNTTFNQLKLC